MGKIAYSNKQIEALIKGIEDGSIDEMNLPEGYYNAITDYLKKGVLKGFTAGTAQISKLDLPLLEELYTNVYMFGAAKTFQLTKEISQLLIDKETGEVRTSREFNNLARSKYDDWNDHWGLTEYNTAIAQGDSAAKWQEIERQKDIMPYLQYSAIGDACVICKPLDGLIAHVDNPIWDKVAPINHFNCLCIVKQRESDVTPTDNPTDIVNPVVEKMKERKQNTFINNVGKTGQVFTKEHPYFDVGKKYREYAKKNFNLPIPNVSKEVKELAI